MARIVLHFFSAASTCFLGHALVEAPSYNEQVAMTHRTVYAAQLEGYLHRTSEGQGRFGPWGPVIDALAKLFGYDSSQGNEALLGDIADANILSSITEEELNQAEYEKAVGTTSMRVFATQVAEDEGLEIVQPSNFYAMLSWYDGTCHKQSYEALVAEMHLCALVGDICGGALAPKGSSLQEKNVSASREVAEGALKRHLHMIHPKKTRMLRTPKEVRSGAMLVAMSSRSAGEMLSPDSASLLERQTLAITASHEQAGQVSSHSVSSSPSIGETASLDEEGYAAVADAKDDEEMCSFVKRVMADEDLVLTDEAGLIAFCPWYSGMRAQQSYNALVAELVTSVRRPVECGGGWLMRGSA